MYPRPRKVDLLGLLGAALVVIAVGTDTPELLLLAAAVFVLMVGAWPG